MTWRDKLEIGLKENAPYRKDNLPPNELIGTEVPQGSGRSAEIPHARDARTTTPAAPPSAAAPAAPESPARDREDRPRTRTA
jgi:hypothetical protein